MPGRHVATTRFRRHISLTCRRERQILGTCRENTIFETYLFSGDPTGLTHELLERLRHTIQKRVLRRFARHGFLEPHEAQDMLGWEHGGGFSLDGSVRIEATDRAGRTALRLSALEFLDRLATILPPPRVHRHRYHGVFAPNAPLRSLVTAQAREDNALATHPSDPDPEPARRSPASPPGPENPHASHASHS